MSRCAAARYRACREPGGDGMSQLMGADTRRVGLIAEGLHGYSEDVQNLRTMAQRAVFEMRNAWGGGDFEHIARRWEQEACLLYTSDAADDLLCVDLGGRR